MWLALVITAAFVIAALGLLATLLPLLDEPAATSTMPPAAVDTTPPPTARPTPSRPGSPDVYASIAAETSCSKLQASFDAASQAHDRDKGRHRLDLMEVDLAYMEAADQRMRDLHCTR